MWHSGRDVFRTQQESSVCDSEQREVTEFTADALQGVLQYLTVNFDLLLAVLVDVTDEVVHLPHQLQVAEGDFVRRHPEQVPHGGKCAVGGGGIQRYYHHLQCHSTIF